MVGAVALSLIIGVDNPPGRRTLERAGFSLESTDAAYARYVLAGE